MPKAATRKRRHVRVVLPDSDKLGFVVASFFATLVLAINLFFRSVYLIEVAFRVALTFAVCWMVTALAAHYLIAATVAEMRAEKAVKRKAREQAEPEVEGEPVEEAPEGITGEQE